MEPPLEPYGSETPFAMSVASRRAELVVPTGSDALAEAVRGALTLSIAIIGASISIESMYIVPLDSLLNAPDEPFPFEFFFVLKSWGFLFHQFLNSSNLENTELGIPCGSEVFVRLFETRRLYSARRSSGGSIPYFT